MSDRMTSRDIEDVLSSIRRLVSEETRAPARPGPAAAERLVLTSDFRVARQEDAAPADDRGLGARVAVLEAAVARRGEDWDPDGTEEPDAAPAPMIFAPAADQDDDAGEEPPLRAVAAEDWQPEAEAAADPDPMDWQDAPHTLSSPARAPGAGEEAETAPDLLEEPGEDVLDEDALRDLIRDIIREELQGVLGERITRNVRKLVRSEINRALAAKAFE